MMGDVAFVDAHVHFWDLAHLHYAWLMPPFAETGPNGNVAAIAQYYGPVEYRAETAHWRIAGVVHVEAGAAVAQTLAETRWLEGQADASGLPSGIVAFADLADPLVDRMLEAQAAHGRVRGIRHIVNWHGDVARTYTPRDVTRDDRWRRGFGQLAEHGLSFDLQCYPTQMPGLVPLLTRHDDVPVFVNHMGMPVLGETGGMAEWRKGLRALADLPQVAIKLSGMGFARRDWTTEIIRPLILETIDLFGIDRCMFASDLPTDRLFGSVDRHLDAYHAIVADFAIEERRALFGANANRLYRLDLDLETCA